MEKKTPEQLAQILNGIKHQKYSYWKHYKGDVYQVTDFAIDCDTQNLMIIYKKMANGYEDITFTRSFEEWTSLSSTGETRFVMI